MLSWTTNKVLIVFLFLCGYFGNFDKKCYLCLPVKQQQNINYKGNQSFSLTFGKIHHHHHSWLDTPLWGLAFLKRSNQAVLFLAVDLQFIIVIMLKSVTKQSTHLFFGLPLGRCPKRTVLKILKTALSRWQNYGKKYIYRLQELQRYNDS